MLEAAFLASQNGVLERFSNVALDIVLKDKAWLT